MNVKKVGLISAGALTALLAVSPLAFATEGPHKGGHEGPQGSVCAFEGGNGGAVGFVPGGGLVDALVQAPIAGNNIANIGNCSNFLNDNLNGNVSNNDVSVLGGPIVNP